MSVTATGPLSLMYARVAEILAACPRLQTALGAANAAEALTRIHFPEVNWEKSPPPTRPLVIVTRMPLDKFTIDVDGARDGSLTVCFELLPAAEYVAGEDTRGTKLTNPEEALLTVENDIGQILLEVLERSNTAKPGGGTYVRVQRTTMLMPAEVCRYEKHSELFIASAYTFELR